MVWWLAEALRDFGHSVTIGALEGSTLPKGVELLPIPADQRSAAHLLKRIPPGTEIVHFHAPPEKEFAERANVPMLTTIHGNGKPGEKFSGTTVFLSKDHATRHGRETYVYNGVNPDEFHLGGRASAKRRSRPLFLSKTSLRTKNLRGAMRIAKHAGMKLTIAGGNRPVGLRLQALLAGYEWRGPVTGRLKAALLSEASSLLFPVSWPEPFGLVMVEAMLSGTPVVASRWGSVPEIVDPAVGRIVELQPSGIPQGAELDLWAAALRDAENLDPKAVRAHAVERFSHLRMAESYLEVYKRVIRGETLP